MIMHERSVFFVRNAKELHRQVRERQWSAERKIDHIRSVVVRKKPKQRTRRQNTRLSGIPCRSYYVRSDANSSAAPGTAFHPTPIAQIVVRRHHSGSAETEGPSE